MMEDETTNEQEPTAVEEARVLTARERARHAIGAMFGEGTLPTDEELDNLAQVAPLAAHLFTLKSSILVDEWVRELADEYFWRLFALAQDFIEWSDSQDLSSWRYEYAILTGVFAMHELRRLPTDEETTIAGQALVVIANTEAAVRNGRVSYVEPYTLFGQPPRAIPTRPSKTEH